MCVIIYIQYYTGIAIIYASFYCCSVPAVCICVVSAHTVQSNHGLWLGTSTDTLNTRVSSLRY